APFDDIFDARLGLSATTASAICEWLSNGMQRQLDRDMDIVARLKEIYDDGVATDTPHDLLIARARSDPRILELSAVERVGSTPFTVDRAALERVFGDRAAAAFWRLFTTRRVSVSLPLGVDESNPVEDAPLLLLTEVEAILPLINPLP